MAYVKEKILNGDLEKTVKMWERKVEIAEASLLSPGRIESLTWPGSPISNHQHLPSGFIYQAEVIGMLDVLCACA